MRGVFHPTQQERNFTAKHRSGARLGPGCRQARVGEPGRQFDSHRNDEEIVAADEPNSKRRSARSFRVRSMRHS
jgi:hypothetical protein